MRAKRLNVVQAMCIFALLAFTQISQAATSDETYFHSATLACDANLDPKSGDCYKQVKWNISKQIGYNDEAAAKEQGVDATANGFSSYVLLPDRPKHVIVTIHGLWGDSDQFRAALFETSRGGPQLGNLISLTLPGHTKSARNQDAAYKNEIKRNPPFANFEKWLGALDETMKVARTLGDEVTVIGQSTGGLLAVIAAYKYPEQVKNVVLVEPALKVQPLLTFGSCTLGAALTKSSVVRSFAKLVHGSIPEGVNVKMGCEVQRMANEVLKSFDQPFSNGHTDYVAAIKDLATKIHQPVYLMNNEKDGVVEAQVNHAFYDALPGKKIYQSINLDGKSPHGSITETDPTSIAMSLDEIVYITNPADVVARDVYATSLHSILNAEINNLFFKSAGAGENSIDALALDRRFCEFVDRSDCPRIASGLKALRGAWLLNHAKKTVPNETLQSIKAELAPVCKRLDEIAKPVSSYFEPACEHKAD